MTVAVVVFGLDFVSKQVVLASSLGEAPVRVAPFFRLVLVENPGAAFGLLANAGPLAPLVLTAFAAVFSVGVVAYLWVAKPPKREALACAMLLGGAAGNLADRIARGKVTDFLDFHIQQWHWPAFNLADSAITLGAILLLTELLFAKQNPKAL